MKMKKLIFSFIACLAFVQPTYAATSGLTESLLEYEAITNAIGAPDFDVIPVGEFIIDIKRYKPKQVDTLGTVKYLIETRVIDSKQNKLYIAILNVAPNPGIGPNIVTVEKIKPIKIRYSDTSH